MSLTDGFVAALYGKSIFHQLDVRGVGGDTCTTWCGRVGGAKTFNLLTREAHGAEWVFEFAC